MKKWMMLAAALVLLTAMTACGGNSDKENADSSEVALDSFMRGWQRNTTGQRMRLPVRQTSCC